MAPHMTSKPHLTSKTATRRGLLLGAVALSPVVFAWACWGGGDKRKDVLDVYAASSLQDALKEINGSYKRLHGVKINMNNAGSGKLSVQIEQGRNCDVFLSAGEKEMDRLDGLGIVDQPTRAALLSNQLVMVVRKGAGEGIEKPEDLAKDSVRMLAIANPDGVPAGRYAREWLQDIGLWDRVEDKVLPGDNVRNSLAAVGIGGAEAGIVYRTDASTSPNVEIAYSVPIEDGPKIRYPVAHMLDRPRKEQSEKYIAYLQSEEALEVFRRYGFLVVKDG